MGRAAILVDVRTIRFVIDRNNLGAEFPQCCRRHLVGRTVGAIDNDPKPGQRDILWHRPLGEFDIAINIAVNTLGPAKRIETRQTISKILIHQSFNFEFDLIGQFEPIRSKKLDAVVVVWIVRG